MSLNFKDLEVQIGIDVPMDHLFLDKNTRLYAFYQVVKLVLIQDRALHLPHKKVRLRAARAALTRDHRGHRPMLTPCHPIRLENRLAADEASEADEAIEVSAAGQVWKASEATPNRISVDV